MTRKSVAVRIAGNDYKILSDGDEESIRETARYVDRKMSDIRERTGTVDTLGVSVLTCLNLAREVIALREGRSGPFEEGRLRALIDRVERAIEGEEADVDMSSAETERTGSEGVGRSGAAGSRSSEDGAGSQSDTSAPSEIASGGSGPDGSPMGTDEGEGARTLSLPSVESIRERAHARSEARSDAEVDEEERPAEESVSEARVAAGGRERAT